MKKYAHILCLLLLASSYSFSQNSPTNDWIDYSQEYLKIPVVEDGVYRVLKSDLKAKGIAVETIPNDLYQIFENGTEIPLNVTSEYIEFYGKKPTDELDQGLYEDSLDRLTQSYSQYTDTSYYFLTHGTAVGLRFKPITSTNVSGLPKVDTYKKTITKSYHELYCSGARLHSTLYHPKLGSGDGWVSKVLDGSSSAIVTEQLDLTDLVENTSARFTTYAIGANNRTADRDYHNGYNQHALVEYNLGGWKNLLDAYFTGFTKKELAFDIEPTYLDNGKFNFKISSDKTYNGVKNQFRGRFQITDINVSYQAKMRLQNELNGVFKLPATSNASHVEITNFNGTNPVVFDIINGRIFNFIKTGTTLGFRLDQSSDGHQIIVSDESTIKTATIRQFKFHKTSILPETDFLIISNSRFENEVAEYAAFRSSGSGGAFTVSIAYVDDLYNEFYYGQHHPMAIKSFLKHLLDNNNNPDHVFFIGKGLNLSYLRDESKNIDNKFDFVPSIGSPCADWYYTKGLDPTETTPPFSVGRLAAITKTDIKNYLSKVKTYEKLENNKWRKNVLHVSGGKSGTELIRFSNYMKNLGEIISSEKMGANITYFGKESGLQIEDELTDFIIEKVDEGSGFLSYFGHAGANVTEVDLGKPIDYSNGQSPLIMFFGGCVLGGCFENSISLGEEFLNASTGAVSWIASATFSFESTVYEYTQTFYKNISKNHYGEDIGNLMRFTIGDFIKEGDEYKESQSWQTLIQGDPALKFYSPQLPDYEITNFDIFITPDDVTAQSDSFYVNLIIKNNGQATAENLRVDYKLKYPNGNISEDSIILNSVFNTDTFTFTVYNKNKLFGEHTIDISLDPKFEIDEIKENNNNAVYSFNLLSNGSAGLFPTEYGIVSSTNIDLIGQSLDFNSTQNTFQFELDTTPTFKSPWRKQSSDVKGKLTKSWNVQLLESDSQDYYWRIRLKLANGGYSPWATRSFSYIENALEGWAQLDFKQLSLSSTEDIYSDSSTRSFHYYNFTAPGQFIVQTHGRDFPQPANYTFGSKPILNDAKVLRKNDYSQIDGNRSYNGMVIYVFEPVLNATDGFDYWIKDFGVYEKDGNMRFDWMKSEEEIDPVILDSFISCLNQIPEGYHVLMYSGYYHRIADMPDRFYKAVESFGSIHIRKIRNNAVWLMVGTKGTEPGQTRDEQFTHKQDTLLESSTGFTVIKKEGKINSRIIGPSKKWRSLELKTKGVFNEPSSLVDNAYHIVAINKTTNKRTVLVDHFKGNKLDLSFIDAKEYPYLQIELVTRNQDSYIPANPKSWIVHYDYLPEGMLNAELAYKFDGDTLHRGQELNFEIGYQNISKLSLEEVAVTYEILDKNRKVQYSERDTLRALAPGNSTIIKKSFSSEALTAQNKLVVKTNPDFAVPELYSFNNNFERNFFIRGDFERPILEVTIDGNRILNGDIVSPNPTIVITGKDNNTFNLLDGADFFEIYLQRPDSVDPVKIDAFTNNFTFYPATQQNKEARIECGLSNLPDGIYTLSVQMIDAAGNTSGKEPLKVSFEVVNDATISNFLPYPNPFSTSTRFVFTLTGSEMPENILIQIMTISGKVVKEITKDELGPLKIGHNVTEYAWNGKDTYGNQLANGVYFYQVKTNMHGNQMTHRKMASDKAFKENFGKIYLLR